MSPSSAPVGHPLPALEGLFAQLKATFAQHVEVADSPDGRLLRVAGLELPLPPAAAGSQALLETVCERLAEVAAFGVTTALTETSAQGTQQRMELIRALALLEATVDPSLLPGSPRRADAPGDWLTTAEVAAQLGMSRPYVSMLCDQGKLGEVTRSEGGHRRIAKQAVEGYLRSHAKSLRTNPAS